MSSGFPGDVSSAFDPGHAGPRSHYSVKLPVFEGPLDLLLHLIRVNEVEITDIPVARIAEQYLEYLELIRELNLDIAGEYLLMAATLAWIKSRMLLPSDEADESEAEPDPRAELIARLLEYKRFKEAAGQLGERRLLGRDVFEARGPGREPSPDSEREVEVDLFALVEAYRRVLRQVRPPAAAHEIEAESLTVHERMIVVMQILESRETIEFESIFFESNDRAPSRLMIVTTFLAILELTRLAALRLYQGVSAIGVPEGPIRVRRASAPGDDSWATQLAHL